jgi:hypothetical protein
MSENFVHVKVDYNEALESKKSLLSLEMDLLRIIKSIRAYKQIRSKELKEKVKLSKKIKESLADLRKIHRIFPKIKIPQTQVNKKVEKESPEEKKKRKRAEKYDITIEQELQEIQKKLSSLNN